MPGKFPLGNSGATAALELGPTGAFGEGEGIAIVRHLVAAFRAVDKRVETGNIELFFVGVRIGRVEKVSRSRCHEKMVTLNPLDGRLG